jgi:hypothetical protein
LDADPQFVIGYLLTILGVDCPGLDRCGWESSYA